MMHPADNYFASIPEPAQGCLLALRAHILRWHNTMTEIVSYGMPFYTYNGKRLCYLWVDKQSGRPYIGVVNGNLIAHELLVSEKRSRMKVMYLDPENDLPLDIIDDILRLAVAVHK